MGKPDRPTDDLDSRDLLKAKVVSASIFMEHTDGIRTCNYSVTLVLDRRAISVIPVTMCEVGPTTEEVIEAVTTATYGPIGTPELDFLDRFVSPVSLTPPVVRRMKDTTGWSSPSHALAAIYLGASSLCDSEWESYGGNPGWG